MADAPAPNRLARETSPYLKQHQLNPVDWHPWGPEALALAKSQGKPILLSVGYAACHWCHVMAHESFEDPDTARLMNAHFINIKVDREERPDVDAIYMGALHRLGEQGGWPLTMFLDADAKPFWGGTYFPPEPRYGRPSFRQVLTEIARLYLEEPDQVRANTDAITASLNRRAAAVPGFEIGDDLIAEVATVVANAFDPERGGFRGAPKFPQWSALWLLWRAGLRYDLGACRDAVLTTLTNICQGGIYDHLGGGFHRYSVDERWLVPHFEKMLYDNALLIDLLTEVWRETRLPLFQERVEETIGWLTREMRLSSGAFASSYDADSEGEEGRFYVWTPDEIIAVLGPERGRRFCEVYDISAHGNFEGHAIPNLLRSVSGAPGASETRAEFAPDRAALLTRRNRRVKPGFDDKTLCDWNGYAIHALARAGHAFGRQEWVELATGAYLAVVAAMGRDARLLHVPNGANGLSTDIAAMIRGALAALEAAGARLEPNALARAWASALDADFWDSAANAYALSTASADDLIARLVTAHDDATPNANALMLSNLMALYALTGEDAYRARAEALAGAFSGEIKRAAMGHLGFFANAIDVISPLKITLSGSDETAAPLEAAILSLSLPGAVLDRQVTPEPAAAIVCVGPVCSAPIRAPQPLIAALREARRGRVPA